MPDQTHPPFNNERVQFLRTVQQHHVQLSNMADQKASILIAASLLVLTIIFSRDQEEGISLTLVVLASFTLASAFFAALAVLPRCRPESSRTHKFNLLFFGSFSQLSEREFTTSLLQVLEGDRSALESMIQDIYQLGAVLYLKKFRYLTWSYIILLAGLACTACAWMVELLSR